MNTTQTAAFNTLVQRWLRHQELRSAGAPLGELLNSRLSLDEARRNARRG